MSKNNLISKIPKLLLNERRKINTNQSYRPREAGGLTVVSSPKGCHG
jgi:hypothetical protein